MRRTILFITLLFIITSSGCDKENSNGKNSLTELLTEPAGVNCASGGFKISTGIDVNDNNILDLDEIQYEEYLCNGDNGANGSNSLINVIAEPSGDFCNYGGIKVESGLDLNNDGILEEDEIQTINYVCNGENGQSSGIINTIRIPFTLAYTFRSANSSWASEIQDGLIYGFNIEDYQNFDSIIFIAQFHRQPHESTDTLWLRLFDYVSSSGITNSELFSVIPNSQLNDPDKRVFRSSNFSEHLIPGVMTLGIQYRSEVGGRSISIHNAEILLHRSE